MNQLYVKLLGRFDIIINGESVLFAFGNSKKSITLLKYLILHSGKLVSSTDLIDLFWSEDDKSSSPENAMRTMVSRIRTNLFKIDPALKDCIISENSAYCWDKNIPCTIDVFEFENLCKELAESDIFNSDVHSKYIKILDLYEGDLSYSENDAEWVVSRNLYLHHLYLKNVYKFIELLKAENNYDTIIQVCRIALDIDTFDEFLNIELMNALKEGGQNNIALMQYKNITNAYYKYLGVEPSEKILGFYQNLIKSDLTAEADIKTIRRNLKKAEEEEDGAFICDYSIFTNIYNLQLRNLERQESKMFLSLITVSNISSDPIQPLILDTIMQELIKILKECLRKGDTISRYSSAQFAILLPMISYTNGNIVINRIKKMFYKKFSDTTTKISFQFGGIEED